jgi:hypothetical protein
MSHEAHFHLDGFLNKQNFRIGQKKTCPVTKEQCGVQFYLMPLLAHISLEMIMEGEQL